VGGALGESGEAAENSKKAREGNELWGKKRRNGHGTKENRRGGRRKP